MQLARELRVAQATAVLNVQQVPEKGCPQPVGWLSIGKGLPLQHKEVITCTFALNELMHKPGLAYTCFTTDTRQKVFGSAPAVLVGSGILLIKN